MTDRTNRLTDQKLVVWRMDTIIGNVLRYGVMIAGAVVLIGGILYLFKYGKQNPDYSIFHGEPADLRTLGGILRNALAFDPRGIIQFGILILIATPLARVAFSVYAFARERDSIYVIVTLFVLAILIFSLTGGRL